MKFKFEESQINIGLSKKELTVGMLLKDIFDGSQGAIRQLKENKGTNKAIQELYKNSEHKPKKLLGNPSLISLSNNDMRKKHIVMEEKIKLLLPENEDFFRFFSIIQERKFFTGNSGKSKIATRILERFQNEPIYIISTFDLKCMRTIDQIEFSNINIEGLSEYFKKILPQLLISYHIIKNDSEKHLCLEACKAFIEQNLWGHLISRMLLTVIFIVHGNHNGNIKLLDQTITFIWCGYTPKGSDNEITPDNIEQKCIASLALYSNGKYEQSYNDDRIGLYKLVNSNCFSKMKNNELRFAVEEAYLKQRLLGLGTHKAVSLAIADIENHFNDNPKAIYVLYKIYSGEYSEEHKNERKADETLNKAAKVGCIEAIFEKLNQILGLNIVAKIEQLSADLSRIEEKISLSKRRDYHQYLKEYYTYIEYNNKAEFEETVIKSLDVLKEQLKQNILGEEKKSYDECANKLLTQLCDSLSLLKLASDYIMYLSEKVTEMTNQERQTSHYLAGIYYDSVLRDSSKAYEAYKNAADLGHELARKKLEKKERRLPKALPTFSQISNSTVCLINHWGNIARTFVASLPEAIKVISLEETTDFSLESHNINYCDNIELFVNNINENHTSFDRVIIALMGDDQNKNLEDGIELLDRLFNLSITNNTIEKALLEKVEIYIWAPYEEASLFVDSNLNNMPDNMYFKVYICDPNRDAALELLYNTPLFVPFLRKSVLHQKGAEQSNVVVFGDSELSINVLRQAVAVSYIGEMHPINITSISKLGESVAARFYSGLDGLYSNSLLDVNSEQKIRCITPRFLSCEINRPDFFLKFVPNNNRDDSVNEALVAANYYIVDIGTDAENIQFAINLRRWVLKSTLLFNKTPVIAVHCRDIGAARALNTIPLSNQKQGEMWFNSYNLHCFGTYGFLYSYQNLIENNVIEMQSKYIHRSYYGDTNEEESYRKAMHDYFSCQYNHDSSIINAISLRYRLFLANCYDNWDFRYYFSSDEDTNLAKKHEEWIKNNIGTAAQIEQSRWNSFMLTRGWSPTTPQQVQGYIEQATGKQHKHMLAKLHPYICEWSSLDSVTADLNKIFKKHKIETKNPSEATKKNVLDTTNILTKFKEKVVLVDHEKDI